MTEIGAMRPGARIDDKVSGNEATRWFQGWTMNKGAAFIPSRPLSSATEPQSRKFYDKPTDCCSRYAK